MDKKCIITSIVDNVLVVNFKANALTSQLFAELNEVLDTVEQDPTDGVVFTSSKRSIFLAGADLFHLSKLLKANDEDGLRNVIDVGQSTFNRISNLQIPTVAAIHGACLGGGYELSLACDYRICSSDKATKIGLPEVTLGILPAWGGSTRLPRLISLPNALKVILSGTPYAAKPAHKLGLVDKIVYRENLVKAAIVAIKNRSIKHRSASLAHRLLPNRLVFSQARKNILRKTKGNYPAPIKILEVISEGITTTPEASMQLEADAFIILSHGDTMRNLLRIFFLQEKSKKLLNDDWKCSTIINACVVGAGTMGAGITQWLSSRGVNVLLKDVNESVVGKGLKKIGELYVQGVLGYKMDRPTAKNGLARVTTATTDVPLHNKEIVFEAIVENIDIKQKVLAQLEEKVSDETIIATNTSALSIDEMATCLKRPERFVGIHFFNPVHKMKLVEVVKGNATSDRTVRRAVQFVQQIGKLPVVVTDRPGFVVNRILIPYLIKAVEMLEDGHEMQAIDNAMVKFGMPMGPFRLMDEIGLDISYHAATNLNDGLGIDLPIAASLKLTNRINTGYLGKKSGRGFYTYKNGKQVKMPVRIKDVDISELIQSMTTEAQKVLDEDVIDDPDMLDFAMIMGTGWAPFKGGPLTYHERYTNTV
jgi:3-hydroxyacyl-CoA dehydrogenase/enoyl-CoA hydratase/3-hydroxybutyryl-CoA epimerase